MLIRLTRRTQLSDNRKDGRETVPVLLNHERVVTIEPGYSGGSVIELTTGGFLHVLETPGDIEALWNSTPNPVRAAA